MPNNQQLTPAQIRVQGAKDALALIEAGAIEPRTGWYLADESVFSRRHVQVEDLLSQHTEKINKQVCEYTRAYKNSGSHCESCALGSLFVSLVNKHNDLTFGQFFKTGNKPHKYLGKFFDSDQIELIETAFEQDLYYSSDHIDESQREAAMDFGQDYDDEKDRLVAILNNIIENDGEFFP